MARSLDVNRLWKIAAASIDFLAPRHCALCAKPQPLGSEGICPDCSVRLVRLSGRRCSVCGRPLLSEEGRCMSCRGRERGFDEALALFAYRGMAARLVGAYKFRDRRDLLPLLCTLLAAEIRARWPDHVLVPVPPRRGRGGHGRADQVELLLRALERRGFPVCRALRRLAGAEQKRLNREARKENARRAYELRAGVVPPRRVLLLDDVITTGATAEACAVALKSSGATERVAVLALAQEL